MTDAELRARLIPLRLQLQSHWAEYAAETHKPWTADGSSMCKFSAAFLELVLGKPWRYTGGESRYDYEQNEFFDLAGFFDGKRWESHNWVTDGERIVDLTASQFGADDIIITSASDPRYRANFFPPEIRESKKYVIKRARQWAAQCELYQAAYEFA